MTETTMSGGAGFRLQQELASAESSFGSEDIDAVATSCTPPEPTIAAVVEQTVFEMGVEVEPPPAFEAAAEVEQPPVLEIGVEVEPGD